jgi:hypothetical protein
MNREERKEMTKRVNARRHQINAMATAIKLKVNMNKDLFDTVVGVVAFHYDVDQEELVSRSRHGQIREARHALVYLCRLACPRATLASVGRMFGRDHSTVLHSTSRCQVLREVDDMYDLKFMKAFRELKVLIPTLRDTEETSLLRDLVCKMSVAWDRYLDDGQIDEFMNTMAQVRAQSNDLGLATPITIQS